MKLFGWVVPVLFVMVMLAMPDRALACSCVPPGSPCEAYAATPAVFAGLVSDVRMVREKSEHGDHQDEINVVRFVIEKAIKGVSGREVEVRTHSQSSACGYGFEAGEHYVVYAHQDSSGRLVTSICSRTRTLAEADEDLAFFRSLSNPAARARVVGTASVERGSMYGDAEDHAAPLADLRVVLEGDGGRFETTTDADGRFEVAGLKAGTYRLSAALPRTLRLDSDLSVTVSGDCTAQVHLSASAVGAITGRVVDHEGRPVNEIGVDLFRTDGPRDDPFTQFTDADGRFAFQGLPAGRFVLGVYLQRSPRVENPFPRTYYPSGSTEADASPIALADGEQKDGLVFRLPERLPEATIEGVVVWPDGSPVAGAGVYPMVPGSHRQGEPGVRTDADGRFSIRVLAGERFAIHASAEVKSANGDSGQARAEPVIVTAGSKQKPLRIVMGQPPGR